MLMTIPQNANQRWSFDFMSDTLADGRRFRILWVIDDFFSRECLSTVVDTSIIKIATRPCSPIACRRT